MKPEVWHDREHETIEAKTRWFRSLSLEERIEVFCSFTDFVLSVNPSLKDKKKVQAVPGRIQVLSLEQSK